MMEREVVSGMETIGTMERVVASGTTPPSLYVDQDSGVNVVE